MEIIRRPETKAVVIMTKKNRKQKMYIKLRCEVVRENVRNTARISSVL